MIKDKITESDGYIVLITVLILGVIVSTIAAYLLLAGASASIASQSVVAGIESKAASIGCAQLALNAIQAAPTLTTPSTGSSTLNSTTKETCSYTISGASPNYTIVSVGTIAASGSNYNHRQTVTTTQTSPTIKVSSWQDTP